MRPSTCMWREAREGLGLSSSISSSFFLGARPLTEPRTRHFNEASWPVSSQDLSTPQPWLQAHDTLPRFYVEVEDLNLSPLAFTH